MAIFNVSKWLLAAGAIGLIPFFATPAKAGDVIIQSCGTRAGYVDYAPAHYGSRSVVRYAEPVVYVDYDYRPARRVTYYRRHVRPSYRSNYVVHRRAPIRHRPIYVERRHHPRRHFSFGFDYVRPRRHHGLRTHLRLHRGRHLHGGFGLHYGRHGHHGRHRSFSFHIGR